MQDACTVTYVLHRTLNSTLPMVAGADHNTLIDTDGKRYLDACGGAAVSCLGHDNPRVRAAVTAQIEQIAFAHTSFFTNQPAEELARLLVTAAPQGTGQGRVMFLGSGSEAMEAALKLARQYHLECDAPLRTKVIARAPSYHGNTLGALATGGHAGRRAPYAPLLMDVEHVDAAYAYRMQKRGESEEAFALRMADLLDQCIRNMGPENVMAFVAEPVVGASLGSEPAPAGYFKRIREICDTHGVLLIADEVMCGMGRTGTMFALEQEDICADITTMAKGLGAGYQPIAAVLAAEKIVAAIEAGSGTLWNGHTYMSHAVAAAAALAVQNVIAEENLIENVRARGRQLAAALTVQLGNNPHVGDIRGRGLFWTIELVASKQTKEPFKAELSLATMVQQVAFERGLMCYSAKGCVDGVSGDHVLLAPAYTSTPAEIDRIASLVSEAIEVALADVKARHVPA